MRDFLATLIGKIVRSALFFRREGGHTLPGLVIEKLFPNYISSMLHKLPEGVIIITGTNGKTTTTKIVAELLRANGKRVVTNTTGSNLTRGIASSIARQANLSGSLNYDSAVLELDEATAKNFVKIIKPRWVLALNVSRDQLDRYGEVDTIASYVGEAMQAATEGIVTNAHDILLNKLAKKIASEKTVHLKFFGAADSLGKFFPDDYELAAVSDSIKQRASPTPGGVEVELADFKGQSVSYRIAGKLYRSKLKLTGQHNFLNGAAALALCGQLLPKAETKDLIADLSRVTIAFGRGELYRFENGSTVELVLVKNPASFSQALASYGAGKEDLMIAINDNIADGRDVSWLWDVNFEPLHGRKVELASGTRAADMALRLSYDGINTKETQSQLPKALRQLTGRPGKKVILATYTAMLQLYKILGKQSEKIS